MFDISLEQQTINSAIGMHGAGGYRAQCGLVEGGLMFIGIYDKHQGKPEDEIVSDCFRYAQEFTQKFGSLRCYDLRPTGFSRDDQPHMCEKLTCDAVRFAFNYIKAMQEGGKMMHIKKVMGAKKEFIDLLLLADEQEDMIDRYLEKGDMFVLDDHGIKGECVVTKEEEGVYELKNIAVLPESQRKGYGKSLIEFAISYYTDCKVLLVGTGDCPSALAFYHSCGFKESHRLKDFFTDNYDHPMFEDGIQLVDMVYLKRER